MHDAGRAGTAGVSKMLGKLKGRRTVNGVFVLLFLLTALIPDYGSYVLQLVTIIAASLATGLFLRGAPGPFVGNRDRLTGSKDGRFLEAVSPHLAAWGIGVGPKV